MMRARWDKVDNMWEVRDGKRWWTVTFPGGKPYICNEKLTVVKPDGDLGKRILRAIDIRMRAS